MAKDNKIQAVKFQTEKISLSKVVWTRGNYGSKYNDLWETIEKMKVGSALKVTLDKGTKFMSTLSRNKFRKSSFKIKVKVLDKEGKVWVIAKFPLEDKEGE